MASRASKLIQQEAGEDTVKDYLDSLDEVYKRVRIAAEDRQPARVVAAFAALKRQGDALVEDLKSGRI